MIWVLIVFFFSSRRRHTRCALVTGVQTCALPIYRRIAPGHDDAFLVQRDIAAVHLELRGAAECLRLDERQRLEPRRRAVRSEEHTSELQSLMRISYAVFCLQNKRQQPNYALTFLSDSQDTMDDTNHNLNPY